MRWQPCTNVPVKIAGFQIGDGHPMAWIAGPCVVESMDSALAHAAALKEAAQRMKVPLVYKSSYDKSNKTIAGGFRGLGWEEGLRVLKRVKDEIRVPILTDVHEKEQLAKAAEVADVLQIPAQFCKQVDLILAAAATGRPLNLKKGPFTAPHEIKNVVNRLHDAGYDQILLTERGVCFGYQTMINDFRALHIMQEMGHPVVFDASHSVHAAVSVGGNESEGNRRFIPLLSRAAAACGVDALFVEMHKTPDAALSDAVGTFPLDEFPTLVDYVEPFGRLARERGEAPRARRAAGAR